MTVDKGTIYGFLGVNGAGKTTIFKLLTGLLKPTMGTAQIFGMDIVKQRIKYHLIFKNLSLIFLLIFTSYFSLFSY